MLFVPFPRVGILGAEVLLMSYLIVCLPFSEIDIGKSVSVSVVSVEKWMVCSFVSYIYYIN